MRRAVVSFILAVFIVNTCVPYACAGGAILPAPGMRVELSPAFAAPLLKGMKIYPADPFRIDFILDRGDAAAAQNEAGRLIKYFLAALTVPEEDLWVNLSPYEKDRIVPEAFGVTEMGRDLLAEDYILKQVTASLLYPQGETGRIFWAEIYRKAMAEFGTTDVPVDTFNKVWIVPSRAEVYQKDDAAFVVDSRLKVMLGSDYLAANENAADGDPAAVLARDVLRAVVIPVLEKEVNEGKNFASLRQVYHSLILATWFKDRIRSTLSGEMYADRRKTAGIDIDDKAEKEKIWTRYVDAFRRGVFDLVQDAPDPASGDALPRKYFSGGAGLQIKAGGVYRTTQDHTRLPSGFSIDRAEIIACRGVPVDRAQDNAGDVSHDKSEIFAPIHGFGTWRVTPQAAFRDTEMAELAGMGFDENAVRRELSDDFRTNKFSIPVSDELFAAYKDDMKRMIAGRQISGVRELRIGLAGIGKKALEFMTVLRLVREAFSESGIGMEQGWKVSMVLIDADRDMLVAAYKAGEQGAGALARLPFHLTVRRIHEDFLNTRSLEKIAADEAYRDMDYLFNRNTVYGHDAALYAIREDVLGRYAQQYRETEGFYRRDRESRLFEFLGVYLTTRNLLSLFCRKGTRYITEPSAHQTVLMIPGTHVLTEERDSGFYEVDDPGAVPRSGVRGFLEYVQAHAVAVGDDHAELNVPEGVQVIRGGHNGMTLTEQETARVALVDDKGELLGTSAGIEEVHRKGLWHMVSHVYLIDPAGRLLLQVRSMGKKTSPGKLQASISGHVDEGEDPYQAVLREAFEEAGFALEPSRLEPVSGHNVISRSVKDGDMINNEYTTVYAYSMTAAEVEYLRKGYNLHEVQEYWSMEFDRFEELFAQREEIFSGSVAHLFKRHRGSYQKIKFAAEKVRQQQEDVPGADPAEAFAAPGGIDLAPGKNGLDLRSSGTALGGSDPVVLQRFQDADGITPVILSITPMTMSLPNFLGLGDNIPS